MPQAPKAPGARSAPDEFLSIFFAFQVNFEPVAPVVPVAPTGPVAPVWPVAPIRDTPVAPTAPRPGTSSISAPDRLARSLPLSAALGAAATRLLRLLCARLFRASLYRHRDAAVRYRGAFGTVYKGRLPLAPHDVAIKLLDVPSSIHDRCVLPDLFAEVPPASCVSICLYLYPYIYIYIYI